MVITHLGILVTTYCNLNCRDCADLIPWRENRNYALEDLKNDLTRLLSEVSFIQEILVIGGETLMYPYLQEVIEFCGKREKIGRIIITTNGVMTPSDNLMKCLIRNDVMVRISGYPDHVVPDRKKVVSTYLNNGVTIEDMEGMKWLSMGGRHKRNREEERLKQIFGSCSMKDCVSMNWEGKIFYCSRSMAAYETRLYPVPGKEEYIDVRNERNLAKQLRAFLSVPYLSTCDYCDGISCATEKYVSTAAQIMDKVDFLELLNIYSLLESGNGTAQIDIKLLICISDILIRNQQCLEGITQYGQAVLCLQYMLEDANQSNLELLADALLRLINAVAGDYNYVVDSTIPCARQLEGECFSNIIKVSSEQNAEADIIVSEEEIYDVVDKKYPIDAITYNRLYIESKLDKIEQTSIECIVSGLSYTQYGMIENNMPVSTANLSITGQDIPYSLFVAKKALELSRGVKSIVIPMAYYQGFYDMSADSVPLHQNVVARIDIPILHEKRNYQGPDASALCPKTRVLEIYNCISDLEQIRDRKYCNIREELKNLEFFNYMYCMNPNGGLKFNFLDLREEERYVSAKITAKNNEKVCTADGEKEVKRYLSWFLENIDRDIKVIFFVPPMTKYLYDAYSKELKKMYYEKIVPEIKKYSNVCFADLANDPRFVASDFCDFEHLNQSGAIKLTEIIGEMVQK